MQIHGPSLGIGAGIAVASIIVAIFVMNFMENNSEKVLEPTTIPKTEQTPLTISIFTANGSPFLGNEDAPIILVEFGDYQCFFCNKFFHETEDSILENYVKTGKVKMIFKDFTIIGPDSVNAAHAAHCANDQGKFWEYHDILYNNWAGENNGWASSANLFKFAQEISLDVNHFEDCMKNAIHQELVVASNNDARTLGLTGTPAFFVIGSDNQITKIGGAQPYEVFEKIFESELKK
jgi:protein-disulfide isomerase